MNPWRDAPTLVGRHVTLRPLDPSDRDALAAAAQGLTDLFYANVSGLADPDAFIAAALRGARLWPRHALCRRRTG